MTLLHTYRAEIALVALSLVVHTACFFLVVHAQGGSVLEAARADDGYFELAQNVLAGNGFSWSSNTPYEPNPLRTPGFVYVLAALIGIAGVTGAAVIQLVLSSAIPVCGMYIARHISASSKIGYFAGIVLAIDPTLALLSFQFYTETLFLLLFLPWLLLTLRYMEKRDLMTLALSALLLGSAVLVKTSAQYIPLIFSPFILWYFGRYEWRRGALHVIVYLGIIGGILAPWVMRNAYTFGTIGLSAQTPFVLYTNLAPAVLSVANNTNFADELKTFLTPAEFKGDAINLANGDAYTKRAVEIVLAHPTATLFIATKSLFTFFTNDGFYTLLVRGGYTPADFLPLLIVARLVWIGITLSAFVGGLVYLFTRRSQLALLLILLLSYFALSSTIAAFGTNPRYRLPVDPIILAFAAMGTIYLFGYIQRFRQL